MREDTAGKGVEAGGVDILFSMIALTLSLSHVPRFCDTELAESQSIDWESQSGLPTKQKTKVANNFYKER